MFQNTYTNAEKLLAAAEELAQTGECNAEDIYRYRVYLICLVIMIYISLNSTWLEIEIGSFHIRK